MTPNSAGLIAGLSTFLGIWLGHAAVRKVESFAPALWLPMLFFAGAGLALEYFSLQVSSRGLSACLGILGITLLWDAFELTRQQKRVRKGHAPANPRNPRHARILAEYPAATPLNPLKREPVVHPLSAGADISAPGPMVKP
jgi:hypothetical protein